MDSLYNTVQYSEMVTQPDVSPILQGFGEQMAFGVFSSGQERMLHILTIFTWSSISGYMLIS